MRIAAATSRGHCKAQGAEAIYLSMEDGFAELAMTWDQEDGFAALAMTWGQEDGFAVRAMTWGQGDGFAALAMTAVVGRR